MDSANAALSRHGGPLVTLSTSDLPGVIREALRAGLLEFVSNDGAPLLHDIELGAVANVIAKTLYLRREVALSVTEPITHLCRGRAECEVCQSASDVEIRKLRDEAREVADWDTSRACCAALGLPTGDGALGLVDALTARARVTAKIRAKHYPLHNLEYRAPRPLSEGMERYWREVLSQRAATGNVVEPETTPWGIGDQSEVGGSK